MNWTALRQQLLSDFALESFPPTLSLPALPDAVTQFTERAKQPNADGKELAQIIETDAGLTIELLRHVNSPVIGLRHRVGNVQQAIALLGLEKVSQFVITVGLQAAVRARKSRLIHQPSFWLGSLQRALFAREVATLLNVDKELAFSGALLQDYLLPVVTNELYDLYFSFTENRDYCSPCICQFERDNLGWDHALAAGCLAAHWPLPDALVCCILLHHMGLPVLADPALGKTAAAAVVLSALLPDQLRQHRDGLEQLHWLETQWPAFRLAELTSRVDKQSTEFGIGVANQVSLSRRCQPTPERETGKAGTSQRAASRREFAPVAINV